MPTQLALALDGHDGAGKTTLARRLAEALDARYVRPYGPPHGERMLASALAGASSEALEHARAAIANALHDCAGERVLVFDRAWLTVFTLLPTPLHAAWTPRIPTMLCWADLATTVRRLRARGELSAKRELQAEELAQHAHYLDLYRELAQRHGCSVLRTDLLNETQALQTLVEWADAHISQFDSAAAQG